MISEALQRVQASLDAALADARRPGQATLMAVSKTHPAERIQEAYDAGQRHFGESYAQELRDKAPALPSDICWHFIGRLQRNKVKYIAPHAFRVHGVTQVAQAEALAARASRPLSILLNVNVGGEASKVGVPPEALSDLVDGVSAIEGIQLVGLMCIPPFTEDPADSARFFAHLAELATHQRTRGHALPELSMGMSRDYPWAVAHGATWVRVGTAIFGPRTR